MIALTVVVVALRLRVMTSDDIVHWCPGGAQNFKTILRRGPLGRHTHMSSLFFSFFQDFAPPTRADALSNAKVMPKRLSNVGDLGTQRMGTHESMRNSMEQHRGRIGSVAWERVGSATTRMGSAYAINYVIIKT